MKKVGLLVLLVSLCYALCAFIQLSCDVDLGGKMAIDNEYNSGDMNVNLGITPGIEVLGTNNKLIYGVGIQYQIPRGFDEQNAPSNVTFNYIPIYGTLKIPFNQSEFHPELCAQLGYNVYNGSSAWKGGSDLSGGLFLGAGLSLVNRNTVISFMYKLHKGNAEMTYYGTNLSADNNYSHIALSLGFRLR